jgi:hypothetical protein
MFLPGNVDHGANLGRKEMGAKENFGFKKEASEIIRGFYIQINIQLLVARILLGF